MLKVGTGRKGNEVFVLLALFILVFLLAGQAYAAPHSYRDKKDGFSFDYPETWIKGDESVQPGMSVIVHAKPVDNFATNFNVVVSPPQSVASATKADLENTYKTYMNDLKVLSFKKTKFLGETCIVADFRWTMGTFKIQQRQYLVDRKGKGYTLTFSALQSNFANYEGAFKTISDSFKF